MVMIQDWQLNVLNKIQGIKKGQLSLTMGGRQTGKSSSAAYMRMWNDLHPTPVERLMLSEGTVYGSPYYCVEPVGGSWLEMEKWCIQSCGESTGSIWAEEKYKHSAQPGERWYGNNRKFWFRDEADRTMFILKWR
jgi:hypothetical protein